MIERLVVDGIGFVYRPHIHIGDIPVWLFRPRFARIEAANNKERAMAKRKIRELPTGVHDFSTLIGDKEN